ncbi:MAG: sensor signal transduction histidine kinase [Acidimicrobiales bacterium]|nr:sensor signal transduction histidine kinase [Acidimicrobiales bacterium]
MTSVVAPERPATTPHGAPAGPRALARGITVGLAALVVAGLGMLPFRGDLDTATVALVLLVPGVVAAIFGGRWAGLGVSVAATLVLNVGYLEPFGGLKVDVADEVVDLLVFGGTALLAATVFAREAERRRAAEEWAARSSELLAENSAIRSEREHLAAEAMALGMAGDHRRALLRSVSHDLRTPLATIKAVITDLRDADTYEAAAREELLDLVTDEADRLDRLVANLLSMSRIDAGALVPTRQAIPLVELFDDCVRRHARLVRDCKVVYEIPLAFPLVDADWALVDQVLTNLLANAVRHAPAGSRIVLRARRRGEAMVEVSVSDEGLGISPELREAIFTPFRTGPGSASSGVGLAIARAIVDAHGGTIGVAETPRGATIAFTLPVHRG